MASPQSSLFSTHPFRRVLERSGSHKKGLELEVRLRELGRSANDPISQDTFERLLGRFPDAQKKVFTDSFYDGIRHTVETGETIRKTKLSQEDIEDLNLRISLALEEEAKLPSKAKSQYQRQKERWSVKLGSGMVQLDMTRVQSKEGARYEVELELLEHRANKMEEHLEELAAMTEKVWCWIQGTELPYSLAERERWTRYFNRKTSGVHHGKYLHRPYANARNLKMEDLTYGGLVGGKFTYAVTDKADGLRMFLVFAPDAVFLLGHNRLNLLRRESQVRDVVFDAEYIEDLQLVLGFDTVLHGDDRVQNLTHIERLRVLERFLRKTWPNLGIKEVKLASKEFFPLSDMPRFYDIMRSMEMLTKMMPYRTDGLMLMPLEAPYRITWDEDGEQVPVDQIPLEERLLKNGPDVCKLKPPEELTVDLHWDAQRKHVLAWDSDARTFVAFRGTREHPLEGIVAEGFQSGVLEFYVRDSRLYAHRGRPDKKRPNVLEVAEDVWEGNFAPIRPSTYMGLDAVLMHQEHKRVLKRFLHAVRNVGSPALVSGADLIPESAWPMPAHRLEDAKGKYRVGVIYTWAIHPKWSMNLFYRMLPHLEENALLFWAGPNYHQAIRAFKMAGVETAHIEGFGKLSIKGTKLQLSIPGVRGSQFATRKGPTPEELLSKFESSRFHLVEGGPMDREPFMSPEERLFTSSMLYMILKRGPGSSKTLRPLDESYVRPQEPKEGDCPVEEGKECKTGACPRKPKAKAEKPKASEATPCQPNNRTMTVNGREFLVMDTIGDGSCLIHAVLQASYPQYNEDPETLVRDFRDHLAIFLAEKPTLPSKATRDDLIAWGKDHGIKIPKNWKKAQMIERLSEPTQFDLIFGSEWSPSPEYPFIPSLQGMQELYRSEEFLGEETMKLLSVLLDVRIMVFAHNDAGEVQRIFHVGSKDHPVVLLYNSNQHFETMAVRHDGTWHSVLPSSVFQD